MSKIPLTLAITAVLATTLTLAACSSGATPGGSQGTGTSASQNAGVGPHNDADVTFTMSMVPHHSQAVDMADTILKKGGIDSRVSALATKIKAEQAPEITSMKSWLTTWGTPTSSMSGMSGMDSGTGMMSDSDMNALDAATGLTASKLFLQQMTQHHQGAIGMAKTEISDGKNSDAVTLAKNIVKGQSAEITEMETLLKSL